MAEAKITSSKTESSLDRLTRQADKIIWRNIHERRGRKTLIGQYVTLQFSFIVCLIFGAQTLAHTQHNQKVVLDEFEAWAHRVFPDDQTLGYFRSIKFTGVELATALMPQLPPDAHKADRLTFPQANYCIGWACPSEDEAKAENESKTVSASSTQVLEAESSEPGSTERAEDLDEQDEHSQKTTFAGAVDSSPEEGEYGSYAGASTWVALVVFAVAVSILAVCLNTGLPLAKSNLSPSELPECIE